MFRVVCAALIFTLLFEGRPRANPTAWAIEAQVDGLDTTGADVAVVGDLVCHARRRQLKVTCVDAATRKVRFSVERRPSQLAPELEDEIVTRSGARIPLWYSMGMSVVGTQLVQGYARRGNVLILRIDTKRGKLVDWALVKLGTGVRKKVFWVAASGARALVALRPNSYRPPGAIAAIDLNTKKVITQRGLPAMWFRKHRHGNLMIFRSREQGSKTDVLRAWDIEKGAEAWVCRLPGGASPKQPGSSSDRIFVADEKGMVHSVEPKTGRVIRSARLTRKKFYTSARPVVSAGQLYVAADRLYRLDPATLKIRGSASFGKAQPIGQIRVTGGAVAVHTPKHLMLYSAVTLKPRGRFTVEDSWRYLSPVRLVGDRMVAVSRFSYNRDTQARLIFFRKAGVATLDLRGLRPGTGVFHRGRPLGGRSKKTVTLTDGKKTLVLLRRGYYPARLEVNLAPGATTVVDPARVSFQRAPTYPPVTGRGRLPDSLDLRRLLHGTPRWIKFPRSLWGADKWVHEGVAYLLDKPGKTGLLALDTRTGRDIWRVESAGLRALLSPARARPRSPAYNLAAIAPYEGLILVITSGQLTNYLAAFSLRDGKIRWRTPVKYSLPHGAATMGAPVTRERIRHYGLHDGMIWCKRGDAIYAYDLRDGRHVLTHDAGRDVTPWGDLVFASGNLYYITVRSHRTRLVALGLYDLSPRWNRRFNSRRMMIRSSDGKRLILLGKRVVQSIRLDGRGLKTRRLAGGLGAMAPVVVDDVMYLCGLFVDRFYAVRQTDLKLLWTHRGTTGQSDPSPLRANRKTMAASADPSQVLLLDPATGRLLEHRTTGKWANPFGATHTWQRSGEVCFIQYDGVFCYR